MAKLKYFYVHSANMESSSWAKIDLHFDKLQNEKAKNNGATHCDEHSGNLRLLLLHGGQLSTLSIRNGVNEALKL